MGIILLVMTGVFIALKLTGQIDWNWFWALSPILIPIILVIVLSIIGTISNWVNSLEDYTGYFKTDRW